MDKAGSRILPLAIHLSSLLVLVASTTIFQGDLLAYYARIDIALWIALLASVTGFRGAIRRDIESHRLLWITGFTVIAAGRVYSIVSTTIENPLKLYIGGLINSFNYELSIILGLIGISICLLGDLLLLFNFTSIVRNPLIQIRLLASVIGDHPVLVSALIAFLVRLAPELYFSNYIIGYDTVEYVSHLRDFTAKPSFIGVYYWMGGLRRIPPMLDWMLYPFSLFVDPFYIFKIYPAIAFATIVALTVKYSTKTLRAGSSTALIVGITTSLSIIMLRES
ncbi:hypothetical protein ACSU1N_03180 [Thermogladius sp. 4427co]|uniref:hypothetical protein n=1 Tax=Thermogladius sp. 4427co TaxID=3450718 RepID=UPI003F7B02E8